MSEPTDRQSAGDRSVPSNVRLDARAEQAARLLHAARGFRPPVNVTLPEIQAAIRARRYTAMVPFRRMAAVAAMAFFPVIALGAVGVSRGWWVRPRPATSVVVTAGGTARIARRHVTLSLRGPGAVEVPGDDGSIQLNAGQLEVANDSHQADVAVEAAGHRVEIAPSSRVAIEAPAAGGQLRLETVAGHPARLDGVVHAEPARAVARSRIAGAPASVATSIPSVTSVPAIAAARGTPETSEAPSTSSDPARLAAPALHAAPAAPPSPAAREVALIRDALERLRGANDAPAALRLLDEHDRDFPDGLLRDESSITRIEALLALGRSGEALQRLEVLAPVLLERSPRLQITRSELRAARGHCPEALADVATVATSHPGDEIERRIERVRARCNLPALRHTREAGGNR